VETQLQYPPHATGAEALIYWFQLRKSESEILFWETILLTVTPSPASSNLVQAAVILGMIGTGSEAAASMVPVGGWTGGVKVYHGVLMQTGTNARRPRQVCPTSLG
jgi:hypothetical protein